MIKLKKNKYISKINPWLLTLLNFPEEADIEEFQAIDLISPNRIDVLIKYLYLKYKNTNIKDTWSEDNYRQHILNFSNGKEGDISNKDSIKKFIISFNQVFYDIKNNGFSVNKSIIPIDEDGIIIDGSHRLTACLILKEKVSCIRLPIKANKYDWQFFLNSGFDQNILEQAILEYIRLKNNSYIICLFPITKHKKINSVRDEINNNCKVIYEKNFCLSPFGMKNFVTQLYKGEPWLGNVENDYQGALKSGNERFSNNTATKLFFVECNDFNTIVSLKNKIRSYYNVGNNAVHINDTYEETLRLSEQILNKNSLLFFNNANLSFDNNFLSELDRYKNLLSKLNIDKDNFVIDGSAILAIFGLRYANDLDYLNTMNDTQNINESGFDPHNYQLIYYENNIDELIYNFDNYFYYDGLKFLNPDIILKMKIKRKEEKDINDANLINSLLTNNSYQIPISNKIKKTNSLNYIKIFILNNFPKSTFSTFRFLLQVYRFLKNRVKLLVSTFLPKNKFIIYKKFSLYVNRNNSLLQRLISSNTYEPELTAAIYNEVSFLNKSEFYFIDIGANIGFLSLNVLAQFPTANILAFEPGNYQRNLLEKTIKTNDLEKNIDLRAYALSNFQGEAEFKIHTSEHNSGDGFVDTQRAGHVDVQKVQVTTLDYFLDQNNIKAVDFIKIDTEGAELLILQGAINTIKTMRPIIFFELHKENIKVYPHTEKDLLKFLSKNNYQIKSIYQEVVTEHNVERIMAKTEDFIAYPMMKND